MKAKKRFENLRGIYFLCVALSFFISGCVPHDAETSVNSNNSNNFKLLTHSSDGNSNANNLNQNAREKTPEPIAENSEYREAARKNLESEKNLKWLFGKKSQTGWYLYKPLIAKEIGSKADADPTEFAAAVARWQKSVGSAPTGIIDDKTIFAFISEWQKRRFFKRGVADSQELVVGSPTYFYDPSRSEELRQIDREAYDAFKKMIEAAAKDESLNLKTDANGEPDASEKFLKIISAYRSRQYQNELRRKSPNAGRASLAVNSPHFTGNALDIYVGGEPVSTKDENRLVQIQTPAYLWLLENAEKFGFYPYFYEPWHWEYVPSR